ncbi:serpin family protein [candidate division KSB1 bacterium]|nr:serpin family protein [candidate division KSB1 bacterium]
MKTKYLIFLLPALILACQSKNPTAPVKKSPELSLTHQKVIQASEKFGLDLFRELNEGERDKNIFFSPLSISMALGMTLNGAAGETAQAMQDVLKFHGLSQGEINHIYRDLLDYLLGLDPKVQLEIANSIWYRQGFSVEQAFMDVNKNYFDSEVKSLDFDDPGAPEIINAWVDEKTHGKIKKIIERIARDTVMYLINAVYFKGTWTFQFDKESTSEAKFYPDQSKHVMAEIMHQTNDFIYYEDENVQAVELPYGDKKFGMVVVLPKYGKSVDQIIQLLVDGRWAVWSSALSPKKGTLAMPKFELEYEKQLVDVLKALGMEIAFSGAADFSGINPVEPLFISDVIHKSYVKVDEEGTEAAAVTAVVVGRTSAGDPPDEFYMNVDRPFVFAIRDKVSGTILFMGKVVNPVE